MLQGLIIKVMKLTMKIVSSQRLKLLIQGQRLLSICKGRLPRSLELNLFPWHQRYSFSSPDITSTRTLDVLVRALESSPYQSNGAKDKHHGTRNIVHIPSIQEKCNAREPICMVTAYDYTSARLCAAAGVDILLVGDSLAQTMLGYDDTTSITMDEMIHHCAAVTRSLDSPLAKCVHRPLVVCDLPFGAYTSTESAIHNGVRVIKSGRADAIKLEGGTHAPAVLAQVRGLVDAGIPVMGHIGLTPQTAQAFGGYRVQGRSTKAALRLLEDALELESAGCFAIVLEMVPGKIAEYITEAITIPTIGIGAGPSTSGQVLVFHDIIGAFDKFVPKFSKQYTNVKETISTAIKQYCEDVVDRTFPSNEHTFLVKSDVLREFRERAPEVANLVTSKRRLVSFSRAVSSSCTLAVSDPSTYQSTICHSNSKHVFINSRKCSYNTSLCNNFETRRNMTDGTLSKGFSIAVIGGGAMGSLLAARLALQPNNRVSLFTSWQEHINVIKEQGGIELTHIISSDSLSYKKSLAPVEAIDAVTLTKPLQDKTDIGIVMTKSNSTEQAARVAAKVVHPSGIFVTLQNGIGNYDILARALPDSHIVQGITTDGARIQRPGKVVQTGAGNTLIAKCNGNSASQVIVEMLHYAGFDCELITDANALASVVWGKLLINCAINPVSALLDVSNGEVLNSADADAIMQDVIKEVLHVTNQKGIKLPFQNPQEQVRQVLMNTSQNFSSMLSDVRRRVPTEIDFINGHVVQEGRALRISTPMNLCLLHAIKRLTRASEHFPRSFADPEYMPEAPSLGFVRVSQCDEHYPVDQSNSICTPSNIKQDRSNQNMSDSMQLFENLSKFRAYRRAISPSDKVGFIPTMGCLHAGHLSLIEMSQRECDQTIVSIFVNPMQFAAHEDLHRYPRTLDTDLSHLHRLGVDAVLLPKGEEMYPDSKPNVYIIVADATRKAEGASRPHFFDGVATVVAKLLNIVQPNFVYFGQKDAQQCATIRSLLEDLNYDITIRVGPTLREEDGVAMSSRNLRIPPDLRPKAPVLYHALTAARNAYHLGERRPNKLREVIAKILHTTPEVAVHYIDIADAKSMQPLSDWTISNDQSICVSVAATLGDVRLIDNIVLSRDQETLVDMREGV